MTFQPLEIGAGAGPLCQGRTVRGRVVAERLGRSSPSWPLAAPSLMPRSPAEVRPCQIPGAPQTCPCSATNDGPKIGSGAGAPGSTSNGVGQQAVDVWDWPGWGPRLPPGESLKGPPGRVPRARPERALRLRLHCFGAVAPAFQRASPGWPRLDLRSAPGRGLQRCLSPLVLAQVEQAWPLAAAGGRTATGKTDRGWSWSARRPAWWISEGLAHHRGSSFGRPRPAPQPSTEHFRKSPGRQARWPSCARPNLAEAESVQTGGCAAGSPARPWRQMQAAPRLGAAPPLDERVRPASWRCNGSQKTAPPWPRHDPDARRSGTERHPVGPGGDWRRRTGPPLPPDAGHTKEPLFTITKAAKQQAMAGESLDLMTLCEH